MQSNYAQTFCFKAPIVKGDFTNELDKKKYFNVLEDTRIENQFLKEAGIFNRRYAVRKRFRGPRVGPNMAPRRNAQSMCLKQYANAVAVYVYLENLY